VFATLVDVLYCKSYLLISMPPLSSSAQQDPDPAPKHLSLSPAINNSTANRDSPILFVHFHKSGGTSVCQNVLRGASQLTITDAAGHSVMDGITDEFIKSKYNCNPPFAGPMMNVKYYHELQTCRHLLPYTMDENDVPFRRINFVAVEIPFREEMPCPGQYRSFATMRDPIQRVKSHMLAHRWDEEHMLKLVRDKTKCPETTYMDGYPIVNSMVIRQLLGRERFTDTRPVDDTDLQRAKELVDRFNVFVPLEHLSHPNVVRILQQHIPEYYQNKQDVLLTANVNKDSQEYQPSAEFTDLVIRENKYDLLLYQYMLDQLGI
jgi:hypothetical protein